jgi:hypothetical protein
MRALIRLSILVPALLFLLQLPVYRAVNRRIVSRLENPPLAEFGLVPIEFLAGNDFVDKPGTQSNDCTNGIECVLSAVYQLSH